MSYPFKPTTQSAIVGLPSTPYAPITLALSNIYQTGASAGVTDAEFLNVVFTVQPESIFDGSNAYDANSIYPGMWISTQVYGQAWRVASVTSISGNRVVAVVQDVDLYNQSLNPLFGTEIPQNTIGSNYGFAFELDISGLPAMTNADVSSLRGITNAEQYLSDLQGRFRSRNLYTQYVQVTQPGHTLQVGQFVYIDPATKTYKVASSSTGAVYNTVGQITSVGYPAASNFSYRPVGQYTPARFMRFPQASPLTGAVGDVYYIQADGSLSTAVPASNAVPAFVQISTGANGGDGIRLPAGWGSVFNVANISASTISATTISANLFSGAAATFGTITAGTGIFTNVTYVNETVINENTTNLGFVTGTGTNLRVINFTGTNAAITNATLTNATVASLTGTVANLATANVSTLNLTGNMSGANAFLQNLAVNSGLATAQATVGYGGLVVVGLNGTTSLQTYAGDVLIGSSLPSNVAVSGNITATGSITANGNLTTAGNLTVGGTATLGAVSLTSATVTNLTATNAAITNATISALTGTLINATTVNSTTENITTANVGTLNVSGNMSGANVYAQNVAVNGGIAANQGTIGYGGLTVVGLNGITSMNVLAGDIILGSDLVSNVKVSGSITATGAITSVGAISAGGAISGGSLSTSGSLSAGTSTLGATTVSTLSATSATATNATITNATITNLTGTLANIATVNATTETVQVLNITNYASGANALWENVSINAGLAVGGATTLGYNGLTVLGLNGSTSLNLLSGDVILGSDMPSNVKISGALQVTGAATISGAITTASALTVGGASTVRALTASSLTSTGALTVSGASALASVSATSITDTGALTVGGSTIVKDLAASSINCTGTLGVTGLATMSSINASGSVLAGLVGATTGTFTNLAVTNQIAVSTGAGANSIVGQVVLTAGTVTVSNTNISNNDYIFLSRATLGGTIGNLSYTISAGASFTINSDQATETSTVNYFIVRQN